MITERDQDFLRRALVQAHASLDKDTYPIGAVLVRSDGASWEERNLVYEIGDVTAHAEMLLFRNPDVSLRIMKDDYTLYCTAEPCSMCISAIMRSIGISRVVCLIEDPKNQGGIRTMKPFSSAMRALGMNWGGAGKAIKLRRVSPANSFVVEFVPRESQLALEAQTLWAQWLLKADAVKRKCTEGCLQKL